MNVDRLNFYQSWCCVIRAWLLVTFAASFFALSLLLVDNAWAQQKVIGAIDDDFAGFVTKGIAQAQTEVNGVDPLRSESRGVLVALDQSTMSAPMAGIVMQIFVQEGDTVARGDPLLQFDCSVLDATKKLREVDLSLAQVEYESQKRLSSLNASSDVLLSKARLGIERQKALLFVVDQERAFCQVTAPFSAHVTSISAQPYAWHNVGSPLLDIVAVAEPSVKLLVSASDRDNLTIGTSFTLTIDQWRVDGEITRIVPVINTLTQLFQAYGVIVTAPVDVDLYPGMSGVVTFSPQYGRSP